MRFSSFIMIFLALLFGALAVFLSHRWLAAQQASLQKPQNMITQQAPASKDMIVVAARALPFGTRLTTDMLKEIPWSADGRPEGAFTRVSEITNGDDPRAVLDPLEANEPILKSKITGEGQRASLSALLTGDNRAVTVPVTLYSGVAGFVLPGDRVDLLVTRQQGNGDDTESFTEVVLQNLRVLGIDQSADTTADTPVVVKAVTLEADTEQAQKIALSQTLGTLSLALRAYGSNNASLTRRIGAADLSPNRITAEPVPQAVQAIQATSDEASATSSIGVTRGMKRQQYAVPRQGG